MTDGEKVRLREAFEVMRLAAARSNKANPAHVNSGTYMGMVCALGWVLGEPGYREPFETMLNETIKMFGGNKVVG